MKALISQGDMVYIPICYRNPKPGELYLTKTGIVMRVLPKEKVTGDRLIVGVYKDENFS